MRLLSLNWDSTYTIIDVIDLNYADRWAKKHVNQLHFILHRNMDCVVQWVGEDNDTMCWYAPINPKQAKLAMLLFALEVPNA